MKTYLVVEDSHDVALLRAMLPPETLRSTHLIVGGSKSSAVSLARSLISDRGDPLLLVMDADTVHQESMSEQEQEIRALLGAVAIHTPYDVILAVPQLEVVLFHDLDLLAKNLQRSLDHEVAVHAVYEPQKTLNTLFQQSPRQIQDFEQFLRLLDATARERLAQHPLIQKIVAFVANAEVIPAV
jgi:hypothetical protein